MSQSLIEIVDQLIEKSAKGEGAVEHTPAQVPSGKESDHEKNKANSGTHPEKGKSGGKGEGKAARGGEDFKDGSEDTIGSEGKAAVARPDSLKHEGGGTGPNHPGTGTKKASVEESDLEKSEDDEEKDDEEKDDAEKSTDTSSEESVEKSDDSAEVYLDLNEFTNEMVEKTVSVIEEKYAESFKKSQDSDYVSAGLAKSLLSTLERVESIEKSLEEKDGVIAELNKAIVNLAKAAGFRKSLITKGEKEIRTLDNPSLGKSTQLSKTQISEKLLDAQMGGNQDINTMMVLKFDSTGDLSVIPENLRRSLGIE